MKKWKRRMFLVLVAITVALGLSLNPGLVKALTMGDLVVPGAFVIIDDKKFTGFQYAVTGSVLPSSADGVTVGPIATPFNPGFTFSGPWTGEGNAEIRFLVEVLPGGYPIIGFSSSVDNNPPDFVPFSEPALALSFGASLPGDSQISSFTVQFQEGNPVPEPATMLLLGSGLLGLWGARRKYQK